MRVRSISVASAGGLLLTTLLAGCTPTQAWRSELVSVNSDSTNSGDHWSLVPVFSPDGRRVAFESQATDLGPTLVQTRGDIFFRDLATDTTRLVSADPSGAVGGNGESHGPVFSPDGRRVAFVSAASNLGPTDTNGPDNWDVYVRDLARSRTRLVSVNAAGTDSGNDGSSSPVFSPDGTKIAFVSSASDLGPPDSTEPGQDVYVRDLARDRTRLVSVNGTGSGSGLSPSFSPVFSPDGTKIAFVSFADDLGPHDTNADTDVYVRDLARGTTTLVSVNATGTDSGNGFSQLPAFSPDGSRIAFQSSASDLGPNDTNGTGDIYVHNLVRGTTSLVSENGPGTDAGNRSSPSFAFSPAGDSIAFWSFAYDLGPNDTNGTSSPTSGGDVYLRDLTSGTTSLVSVNAAGTDSGNAPSGTIPVFSPDGTRVAFTSRATNLGPGDSDDPTTLSGLDLYVRDLVRGTTSMVSTRADGTDSSNGDSRDPSFGPDGRRIAFVTTSSDLGPADAPRLLDEDVYVATRR